MPRAGINIGEGTFGGHVIEFCDVFDTVKETGDHGSFNSWGRDRFWGLGGKPLDQAVREAPDLPKWDAAETTTLRNNRWRCDHGWDIDLDDGSTNYHIYNNLCLHGGIKNREGFDRVVENNITVGNTFHPHVWYPNCRQVFSHNIVMTAYQPIGISQWGDAIDSNFFTDEKALRTAREKYHTDAHSLAGDPLFIDPAHGDYRVGDDSPALKVGFKNFPMDQFGVVSPRLKAEAKTPRLTNGNTPEAAAKVDARPRDWLGGKVRNIAGPGEQSVYGLPDAAGVLVIEAPAGSAIGKLGLKGHDVIIGAGGKGVNTVEELFARFDKPGAMDHVEMLVVRAETGQGDRGGRALTGTSLRR